jgi:iron complex transport system permease protein
MRSSTTRPAPRETAGRRADVGHIADVAGDVVRVEPVKRGISGKTTAAILIALPLVLFYASLFLGRYPVAPLDVLRILASKVLPIAQTWSPNDETIVMQVRLPREILALVVGAGLSISGAAFQGMFRNPLVSTDLLGVSAAAGCGAALAMLLGANDAALQGTAFIFGLAGVALTYMLSRVYKTTPILMLVLSGVAVTAFFSAAISAAKYLADPDNRLPAVTYWLLGSFSRATYSNLLTVVPLIGLATAVLILIRYRLNVLAMGDEEARSLGLRTELHKGIIIVCATVITATAVSVSGLVGWVGLLIPHVARMIVGPDHRVLLPATLAIGAAYLVVVDTLARTISPQELPLGILTAMIGAPFFAYLLRRTKGGWK